MMELAKQQWKILAKLESDFAVSVREFLVFGKDGEGVVMATEPHGVGSWFGVIKFDGELRETTKPTHLGVSKLIQMAHGLNHIVLLDELGQIYGMGGNQQGQLGLGTHDKNTRFYPHLITSLNKFISICCGLRHSLALTEEGKVWGWGENSSGQLGLPWSSSTIFSPRQISQLSDHRVVAIECGENFSLALTDQGKVFAWGNNYHGQLGHEEGVRFFLFGKYLHTPTEMSIPSSSPVIQIAAGRRHTLLLTKDGLVFACGSNGFCQLGVPNFTWSRSNLCQVSSLPPISHISSHFDTDLSIAMATYQRCWVWGRWDSTDTFTPRQLPPFYSTVESPLSSGPVHRSTPRSVRVQGQQSPQPLLTSNLATQTEPTTNPLLDRISRMFDNPDSEPDLQFVLEDKSILAHRTILQISSGHLSRLFAESSGRCADLIPAGPSTPSSQSDPIPTRHTTNPSEPDSDTPSIPSITPSIPSITPNITRIPITGHSYPTFHSFIRFFYTGQMEVSSDLLPELYELSHHFGCPDLQRLCLRRMLSTVSLSTCCPYYQLADRHQLSRLQSQVVKFIADNLLQVIRTEAYRSLNAELAQKLTLAIADLNIIQD